MSSKKITYLTSVAVAVVAASMAIAQEPPKPTKMHAVLKKDVGLWEATVKVWLTGPDGKPEVSKATERVRMLGGMWAVSEFKGTMFGSPFVGRSQTGYDPSTKKFVGTWVDSTAPYMSHMQGTYDEKTNTLTMQMEGRGPSGEKTKGKNVTKWIDKDNRVFTMYMKQGDAYAKMAEITYKRKPRKKKK